MNQEPWVEKGDTGGAVLHGVIHNPQTWRVLVDCSSNRTYRLNGFRSSDFNQFTSSLGLKEISPATAVSLARFYLTATYREQDKAVVGDVFAVEQAVGKAFRRFSAPEEALDQVKKWRSALPQELRDRIGEPHVTSSVEDGYRVSALVVRTRTDEAEPKVELRETRLKVSKQGRLEELGEVLLFDGSSSNVDPGGAKPPPAVN